MLKGKVKFFDTRKGKMFGFVVCIGDVDGSRSALEGEEYFFHYNDGVPFVIERDKVRFAPFVAASRAPRLRAPQKGDEVIFDRSQGNKGPKASPWGYASSHSRAQATVDNRGPGTTYRIRSQGNGRKVKVDWEGSDIERMLERYPMRAGTQRTGGELTSYFSHNDGFTHNQWLEKLVHGKWIRTTEDPRQRVVDEKRLSPRFF